MERCVDSDYLQPENEATKEQKNATCSGDFCLSNEAEEESQRKDRCEVPRVDEEIAAQARSSSAGNLVYNGTRRRGRRHRSGRKVNVLKERGTGGGSQSVQKKTKINKSNVPDRLGKYVSESGRGERRWGGAPGGGSAEVSAARDGYTETKIALLGNECLSNEEADRLRNSFESDLETKNIFENLFGECVDSTSKRSGVSSQEEAVGGGGREGERTPEQRKAAPPPGAPVKLRDHSSYYRSHKSMRHVCEYCHKIFKSNGKLNSHVYSHTGERPFDCSHCGKAFSSKFKLVRHLLIHSEVRKFVCQICDRTFLRNDHLKNHYKVHDPQKKMYKCPKENCDKEYSSVMSHKKHMAYHSVEDGDLKCLICSVKYETKEEVLYHLKSHSGSRLFKTQSDKKFKCDFCERLFLTRKDVTRHLVVHTGERDFLCQFCPQRFGRKDHLVRHIKKSHSNEDLAARDPPPAPDAPGTPPKPPRRPPARKRPPPPAPTDTNTRPDDTHILITLQGNPLQNRKKKPHKKPFHKNEPLVPNKKHPPPPKPKNPPPTQILLQNIPNILIIPNNSIILLRNQPKKDPDPPTPDPPPPAPPHPAPPQPPNDLINFPYDPTIFPEPSDFLPDLPDPEPFCGFHPDLPFDPPDFDLPPHTDLALPPDALPTPALLPNGPLLPDAPCAPPTPAPKPHPPPQKPPDSIDLLLHDSILADFKDDAAAALPPDSDPAVLGSLLNQGNDNCGFELLRHLLTTDNPVLSPLPGFSQIFHNSNANPN